MQERAIGFNSVRRAQAMIAVGFIALNCSLFLPFYLVFSYENNFTPFFPLGHPRGAYDWQWPGVVRSMYEYVMQLFVRRHNLDIFRLSAEWVFLCSTLVLASRLIPRWRRGMTTLAGLGYALLLSFLVYSAFIHNLRAHPAILIDDAQLLYSGWVFIRDTWTATLLVSVGGVALGIVTFGAVLTRYLNQLWHWRGGTLRTFSLVTIWCLSNLYCALSLGWFGIDRNDPIVQLQSKHFYGNWQRSQDVLNTVRRWNTASLDRLIAPTIAPTPVRRPDIYLFEIESYGAAWWMDPVYDHARHGLVDTIERELHALQLPIVSRFATAPVHGGGSWMSTASVLSGLRIDSQTIFSAWKRLAERYPHLINYLNEHGYYTLAVQPGATWREDFYGYDDTIIRADFDYDGPVYSFGVIPDQWALEFAFAKSWTTHASPRLMHFISVSTHFAWHPPPRITAEAEALRATQAPFIETRPDYAELARTIPAGRKQDYFVTMAYEWELLLNAFRQRIKPGFIALIFGDHQPPFITDGHGGNNVVLHVISDLPNHAQWLTELGFRGGAEPAAIPPNTRPLRLEGIYSLLLALLTSPDGSAMNVDLQGIAPAERLRTP